MSNMSKVVERDSFKIIVLGEAGVGKSSLIRRFTQGTFCPRTTTTIGVDRIPAKVNVDEEELRFQVLDTSGSFGFRGLIKSYMTNIDAVVFMYDISNKESFASLPLWTTLLRNNPATQNLTKVLVGNKRDLGTGGKRQVKFRNAKNYAEFEGMISMEISVKEEESVDLVFQCIARELKLKRQVQEAALNQTNKSRPKYPERHLFFSKNNISTSNVNAENNRDFIEYDDTTESSPNQFARKLSLLITGRGRTKKQQQFQHTIQTPQPQRKKSESTLHSTLRQSKDDSKAYEKQYLLW